MLVDNSQMRADLKAFMVTAIDAFTSRPSARKLDVYVDEFTLIKKGRPERVGESFVVAV